jgi:molybdopterin/thiamine biosynthesis adenylyltransferase
MLLASKYMESRYSRQMRFAGIGEAGQAKLLASRVAIVGCGALGTVQAEILARAGVGRLRIIDRDYVEESNLQRQFLFEESDAAEALPKAAAAVRRLARVNSTVQAEAEVADLTPANIEDLFEDVDLILDGTDNFETRYLINDWAVRNGKPWIYGAAVGSYGIAMPVIPGMTSCFACIYPEPPQGPQPTCETSGVLGSITATVAAWQAATALRLLTGLPVAAKMTTFDVWAGTTRQVAMPQSMENCTVCSKHEFRYLDGKKRAPISLCGRNAVQIHERERPVNLAELAVRLEGVGKVRVNEFALRLEVPGHQVTVFPDGRAIIKGTVDPGVARSVYSRYIGN